MKRLKRATKLILRRVFLPILLIHLGLGGIAAIRNASVKSDEYGAILLSDYAVTEYDYWASPLAIYKGSGLNK